MYEYGFYYERVVNSITQMITITGNESLDREYYCIPRDPLRVQTAAKICKMLCDFLGKSNVTILDLGCGWGTGLFPFMNIFGHTANYVGIELRPEYEPLFKLLLEDYVHLTRFIIGNINKLTKTQFDAIKPDIVYLYCPLQDYKEEARLEHKLVQWHKGILVGFNPYRTKDGDLYKEIAPGSDVFIHKAFGK